jgi:hypothetical protein
MFAALGAEPVVLPNTRTRTALATGLIDAAENNWPSYVASDHCSVAPYFALTEHTMTPDVLIMSMKAWFLSKKSPVRGSQPTCAIVDDNELLICCHFLHTCSSLRVLAVGGRKGTGSCAH